jgi:hypothetical protein
MWEMFMTILLPSHFQYISLHPAPLPRTEKNHVLKFSFLPEKIPKDVRVVPIHHIPDGRAAWIGLGLGVGRFGFGISASRDRERERGGV